MSDPQDQAAPIDESGANPAAQLPRSVRGYDCAATEALVGELSAKREELERECTTLRERVAELEGSVANYRTQERLVAKTLISATGHAATVKESARQEAEVILGKAREEFARRTQRSERIERERVEAEQQLLHLRKLANEMQSGLSGFLTKALEELEQEGETPDPNAPRESKDAGVSRLAAKLHQDIAEHRARTDELGSMRPAS